MHCIVLHFNFLNHSFYDPGFWLDNVTHIKNLLSRTWRFCKREKRINNILRNQVLSLQHCFFDSGRSLVWCCCLGVFLCHQASDFFPELQRCPQQVCLFMTSPFGALCSMYYVWASVLCFVDITLQCFPSVSPYTEQASPTSLCLYSGFLRLALIENFLRHVVYV